MTNFFLGLARGPIDHNASAVINSISDQIDLQMGSVVKFSTNAIPSAELLPRVIATTGQSDITYAIVVGGDADGIYPPTGAAVTANDSTKAALSAGDGVVVVTQGRCLARVDGATGAAIVTGSPLAASATAGVLELADAAGQSIIARALQPSTGATDVIAIDIQREGLSV